MYRLSNTTGAILSAILVMTCANSHAAITEYSDRATFIAATGSTDLPALMPEVASALSLTAGGFTFTPAPGSTLNNSLNWSTLISGDNDLAVNGVESFNVASTNPLFAFGFDFHEPNESTPPGPTFPDTCNAACVDSEFRITLKNGASVVGMFDFTRPKDSLEFVGFSSMLPFDTIELRETVGTADNEFFGNFLAAPVPEPGALVLLGIGLAGLAAGRRKKCNG